MAGLEGFEDSLIQFLVGIVASRGLATRAGLNRSRASLFERCRQRGRTVACWQRAGV